MPYTVDVTLLGPGFYHISLNTVAPYSGMQLSYLGSLYPSELFKVL